MSIGLANFQTPYTPNTILLNAAGNSSHSKTLYPGCYSFYTQGAGGGAAATTHTLMVMVTEQGLAPDLMAY